MTQPLVSVVTPFYNTEPYLEECIESVLAQRYENFEYILANNCSTDRSRDIAQKYASRDKRVKLIDNERFLTQAQNYNNALRHISPYSKYCKVVQADDWIFPECLSSMVGLAEAHPPFPSRSSEHTVRSRSAFTSSAFRCDPENSRAMMSAADSGLTACTFSGRRPAYSIVAISSAPGWISTTAARCRGRRCMFRAVERPGFRVRASGVDLHKAGERFDYHASQDVRSSTAAQAHDDPSPWPSLSGALGLCPASGMRRRMDITAASETASSAAPVPHARFGAFIIRAWPAAVSRCRGGWWRFMPSRPRWIYCSTRKALPRGFGGDGVSDTGLRRRHQLHAALHPLRALDCDRSFAIDWGPQHSVCVAQPRHNSGACG